MAAKDMKIDPPTGIKVGIIGGGIGGLTAAIECHRKGHSVRVFERKGWFESFGMDQPLSMNFRRASAYLDLCR